MRRLLMLQKKRLQRRKRKNNPFSIFGFGFSLATASGGRGSISTARVGGEHWQSVEASSIRLGTSLAEQAFTFRHRRSTGWTKNACQLMRRVATTVCNHYLRIDIRGPTKHGREKIQTDEGKEPGQNRVILTDSHGPKRDEHHCLGVGAVAANSSGTLVLHP